MLPETNLLDVVALILVRDEKILVAQRPAMDRLALKWEFPGGKIEKGETPEEALIREIREELEVDIKISSYFMTVEHLEPPVPLRLYAYFAELQSGEPLQKEHQQIQWIPYKELLTLDFAPADIPIAQNLIRYLKNKI